MSTSNFNLREIIYTGGDDPEIGTNWRAWWDGQNEKIPSYFAHLAWWSLWELSNRFVSPNHNWDPDPKYIIGGENIEFEDIANKIENDVGLIYRIIDSFTAKDGGVLLTPYEFEDMAWQDNFLHDRMNQSMAVYGIRCFDLSIAGLITGNSMLTAMSVAYAYTSIDILRGELSSDGEVKKRIRSEMGRHAAGARHSRTGGMKTEAIRLYSGRVDWPSRRQAAKTIYPMVQAYGKEIFQHQLSEDRGEQTIYEWLSEHDNRDKSI